jgi:hypothetical protein
MISMANNLPMCVDIVSAHRIAAQTNLDNYSILIHTYIKFKRYTLQNADTIISL